MPPSPASSTCGGKGGAPMMHLASLQSAESAVIAPSTPGDDDSPRREDQLRVSAVQPPTPPRRPSESNRDRGGGAAAVGGTCQSGTCLVQMPDADGRWQPVKLTASMCGSPVGSINPSLAPSDSTVGGRSVRMQRGPAGPASIPEDSIVDEDEEY